MTNDNLPPERPLTDQARAVRKAHLMREIGAEGRSPRRWIVPAVAAAAVVAAVAVGGAVLAGGDDPRSRPGVPAGSGGPAEPSIHPDTPTPSPTVPGTPSVPAKPSSDPSSLPSMVPGEGTGTEPLDNFYVPPEASRSCGDLRIPVPGSSEISSIPIGDTTVRLFGNADKWIVCDEWAALDGGDATLLHPHAFGEPLGRGQFGISMNFSMDDPDIGEYVAGGALPDGVESITYTFADGHVEEATLSGDMWAMAYFASGRRALDGATVDVGLADGSTEQFDLSSPMDFCTQSNHGC